MGLGEFKRRDRKRRSQNSEPENRGNKRFDILGSAIICLMIAGLSVILVSRCSRPKIVTEDYEGVILDRWAGYTETDEGSWPYFRLLIEDDNQHRLTVNVDADTYHRSKVGMRVTRRKGKIELTERKAKPG